MKLILILKWKIKIKIETDFYYGCATMKTITIVVFERDEISEIESCNHAMISIIVNVLLKCLKY